MPIFAARRHAVWAKSPNILAPLQGHVHRPADGIPQDITTPTYGDLHSTVPLCKSQVSAEHGPVCAGPLAST